MGSKQAKAMRSDDSENMVEHANEYAEKRDESKQQLYFLSHF
jgi:hypothetical protein